MKRTIFGLVAAIVALATFAFTTPAENKHVVDHFFLFDIGNYAPTQANIENEALWIESTDANTCSTSNQQACGVRVPESMTNAGTPRTLKTTANLQGSQYLATGVYYVSSAASGVVKINTVKP